MFTHEKIYCIVQYSLADPKHNDWIYWSFWPLHRFINTCTKLHKLRWWCTNANQKSWMEYHRTCGYIDFDTIFWTICDALNVIKYVECNVIFWIKQLI